MTILHYWWVLPVYLLIGAFLLGGIHIINGEKEQKNEEVLAVLFLWPFIIACFLGSLVFSLLFNP